MPGVGPGDDRQFIGVDPGASGGIVFIYRGIVKAHKMPATDMELWKVIKGELISYRSSSYAGFACLELVGGYAGQGHPGSAMFKFGQNYGAVRMALTAAGVPYETVAPGLWQRAMGFPSRKKGEAKGAFKNRLKARAEMLFPSVSVTLATADALLIAEYCRRSRTGTLDRGTKSCLR